MMVSTDTIAPIVYETYGRSSTTEALVKYLADRIAEDDWGSRGREYRLMLICWDWMTGGTTAESVARKIEAALEDAEALEGATRAAFEEGGF